MTANARPRAPSQSAGDHKSTNNGTTAPVYGAHRAAVGNLEVKTELGKQHDYTSCVQSTYYVPSS